VITCPSCNTHLSREKSPEGIFWRCENCEGRLLAVPVARNILDKKLVNGLWLASGDITLDRKRECPLCRNPMAETLTSPTDHPVHVDVCRSCHYIWFDTHELSALVDRAPVREEDLPAEVKQKRLPEKAREVMAQFEVERIRERAKSQGDGAPEDDWQTLFTVLGLPVEEETPPIQRAPYMTWALGILMVLVFALTFRTLYSSIQGWGLIPGEAARHYGLTWITSIFLHAGLWHLLGNLYFFLIFADNVEDYLGKIKFLILFFLAGWAGDALHMAFDLRSTLPSVGASGAISGIIAFYALQFPKARLCILFNYSWFYWRWIRFSAWAGFLIWLAFQALITMEQIHGQGNVSGLAHLGGVIIGVAFWLIQRIKWSDVETHTVQ